jgi:hypothetical protein
MDGMTAASMKPNALATMETVNRMTFLPSPWCCGLSRRPEPSEPSSPGVVDRGGQQPALARVCGQGRPAYLIYVKDWPIDRSRVVKAIQQSKDRAPGGDTLGVHKLLVGRTGPWSGKTKRRLTERRYGA